MKISANSSEFLDPIYNRLETHPVIINSCLSRSGGCDADYLLLTKSDLDLLRKEIVGWKAQNRIIVHFDPKIICQERLTMKEVIKRFSKDCLAGFGTIRPIVCDYIENFQEMSEEILEELDFIVLEEFEYNNKFVAYVPMENGELILGAY